jgi:hypothetical protein
MKRRLSVTWILSAVILGAVIGSALGQVIGLALPDGVVKEFFTNTANIGFDPVQVNLGIIDFTLGFYFRLNVIGVIGIVLAAYIFRWYA